MKLNRVVVVNSFKPHSQRHAPQLQYMKVFITKRQNDTVFNCQSTAKCIVLEDECECGEKAPTYKSIGDETSAVKPENDRTLQ